NETIASVTANFDKFEFGEAGRSLYHFIWDEFCNWYIEMAKETLQGEDEAAKATTRSVLAYTLNNILRLMHPIMPFVTEEIWAHIPHKEASIVTAAYPTVDENLSNPKAASDMNYVISLVKAIRNARNKQNVALSKPIEIIVKPRNAEIGQALEDNIAFINRFTNPESFTIDTSATAPDQAVTLFFDGGDIYLPLAGFINIEEEIARLEKELAKWQSEVDRVEKKLSNERFVANAPEAVVEEERQKGQDYRDKLVSTKERIAELQG
ncbi:class I tRNA ligase family protein, partial [Aerococcus sp. L_32]